MIARVTTCQTTSDKLDEVVRSFKENVIPGAKLQKGYQSGYLLTDRKTGKVISIGFWDSEKNAIADEQSGEYQRRVDTSKNLFTSSPVRELYELSIQD